jgi:hypothetical protein
VLALIGCGSVGESTGVDPDAQPLELNYSMEPSEFQPSSALPPNLLLIMTVQNGATVPIERTYPAGCPVRLRIYRQLDSALLYDETKVACTVDTPVTFLVQPGESRAIGSGFRQMTQIMGDSIPCGHYRLVGVPQTERTTVIEIEAGEAFLRAYPAWPAPNPDAVYQC